MKNRMMEDFLKYVAIDTMSDPESTTVPSTPNQIILAKIVAEDLKKAGVDELELTSEGFIYATINSNAGDKTPTLGFLAHLDTANEAPGKNVKPRFIENYQGGEISFPANPNVKLNYDNAPHLKNCIGHTIITSDGTTLLGGDDKAGLAVLVEMVRHFKANPDVKHGKIRIGVIPDEETGVGTERLDLKKFGCDIAYTMDAGEMGEIDIESFNGFMGKVVVEGISAFPGYGKGIYLNASQVLSYFVSKMEDAAWPQNAAGRDPIWWVDRVKGEVANAEMAVYLRNFDLAGIEIQKKRLDDIKQETLKKFPTAKISIEINETYKNYKYELEKEPRLLQYATEAIERLGIKPKHNYVRGGNDSCHLCFSGLPSTNIFVGMQNMHSLMEWNTVETIVASAKAGVEIAKVWYERSQEKK